MLSMLATVPVPVHVPSRPARASSTRPSACTSAARPSAHLPHARPCFSRGIAWPCSGASAGTRPRRCRALTTARNGRFFFQAVPMSTLFVKPLMPFVQLMGVFPFTTIIIFFGVYLGIVNNTRYSRFVRFNAAQALMLDILLIFPQLVEGLVSSPAGGPGLQAFILAYNTVFFFIVISVFAAIGFCLTGNTLRLPIVAEAADAQAR